MIISHVYGREPTFLEGRTKPSGTPQRTNSIHTADIPSPISAHILFHWIGLRDILQESPICIAKIMENLWKSPVDFPFFTSPSPIILHQDNISASV